ELDHAQHFLAVAPGRARRPPGESAGRDRAREQVGQQRIPAPRDRARGARRAHRGGSPHPERGEQGMIDIDAILKELVARRGSDLHLKVNRPPLMRISSDLLPSEFPPLTEPEMTEVLKKMLGPEGWARLENDFE